MCFFCFILVLFFLYSFFFNDTATTEIYTLSLHDALPICDIQKCWMLDATKLHFLIFPFIKRKIKKCNLDRKSTRLNSSHLGISYAVFCLKKKKNKTKNNTSTEYYKKTNYKKQQSND